MFSMMRAVGIRFDSQMGEVKLFVWCSCWAVMMLQMSLSGAVLAEETKDDDKKPAVELKGVESVQSETLSETQGSTVTSEVTIDGVVVPYVATIKMMSVTKDDGKSKAKIYYTEYLRENEEDLANRPVTFCFNGGPGSASIWLHLGGLSPKKVYFQPSELNPESHELKDNPDSLLDLTDLVFIDPVNTGFSVAEKEDEKTKFLGLENDIETVGEFIRLYLTKTGRWDSPKYILGESYGGIRGSGLVNYLWDRHYISTNGLIMVSPVVDYQTLSASTSNDLPYVLFLPSFAATAWFHHKTDPELGGSLEALLKNVEKFALNKYSVALLKGDSISQKQKEELAETMSGMIGLSKDYILQSNLRVSMGRFGKELLREDQQVIGRYDGRFKAPTWDGVSERTEFDPSGSLIGGGFATSLRGYFFEDFQLKNEATYEVLSDKVRPWSYGGFENRYVEMSGRLKQTMFEVPGMKVFIACGYMDLATPYLGITHTVNHLGLPEEYRVRITYGYYPAGHMMYIDQGSQEKLHGDLKAFYE